MAGWLVYDTYENCIYKDGCGHLKVYASRKSAMRRAYMENSATVPTIARWIAMECVITIQDNTE